MAKKRKTSDSDSDIDCAFWYSADKKLRHQLVFEHVEAVETNQRYVRERNVAHAQLYSNRYEPQLGGHLKEHVRSPYVALNENILKSGVDTATNLIGKSRVKGNVLTDGAEWDIFTLAKDLDKYLWGLTQRLGIHQKMLTMFRDACIFGTGVLAVFAHRGQLKVERVLIDDIIVDECAVPVGEGLPRQLHRVRYISREVLKRKYPKHAEEIENASAGWRKISDWRRVDRDLAMVIESHHLPSAPGAGDGVWQIAVDTAILATDEWKHEWYPYVFYHWCEPVTGFYGQGIPEEGLSFQIRLNQLNDFKRRCQDLISNPRVLIEQGSRVLEEQLTNEIASFVYYTGQKPEFFSPQAVNAEIYNEAESIKHSFFDHIGISRMAATANKPQAVEAAVALRELSDNQSQRFSGQQQRHEDAYLELYKKCLMLSREVYKTRSKARKGDFLDRLLVEEIDWNKVNFEGGTVMIQVQASSIMSETPAGRLQRLVELKQYNVPITDDEFRRLLAHPDLEQSDKRATAPLEFTEWTISELYEGRWVTPEPFMDLARGIEWVNAAYLLAVIKRAPDNILEILQLWIETAEKMFTEAQEEAAAMAAAQVPGGPMGVPGGMPGMDPGAMMGGMPPEPQQPLAA